MSQSHRTIEWNRLLVEGVVIVASILLAFAIDAWWDNRQEQQAEKRQLLSIVAELETNAERLREKLETLQVAEGGAKKFLAWMGPEPAAVQQKELTDTFTEMYDIGGFALLRGASDTYLSGARVEDLRHDDLRKSIAEWYAAGDDLEQQYTWLREIHTNIRHYLTDTVPMHYFNAAHPLLQGIPGSRFPLQPEVLLSDPRFESLVSLYLIRIKFVQEDMAGLIEGQAELLDVIRAAAGN